MKIINYPAMASPQSITAIDTVLSNTLTSCSSILDPFCGTGRLLLRPRANGHNVTGIDCSPLAILASKCSHHPVSVDKLSYTINNVINFANSNNLNIYPSENELFWFHRDTITKLYNLLYCIDKIDCSKSVRRVLWLILADTSRNVSYTREQEYKLHRINEGKRRFWNPDVVASFSDSGAVIHKRLVAIKNENMKGRFKFFQGDLASLYGKKNFSKNCFNAIITSPPYGDSASTVGYGQFARIPLMILSKSSLFAEEFNLTFGKNYDSMCMGGTKCFFTKYDIIEPKLPKKIISHAMKRFNRDYFVRLSMLTEILKKDGIISLIIGDRISNGTRYPLVDSTSSYLLKNGLKEIFRFDRFLSHKRLPRTMKHSCKNMIETHNGMNYETICCFQKG